MSTINFIRHNNKTDAESLQVVQSIPADEICILQLGGAGISSNQMATKLAENIADEIINGITDIPNYVFVYDKKFISDDERTKRIDAASKRILFDKYNQNVLGRKDDERLIYVSQKNINSIFKHKIAPLIQKSGINGLNGINFVTEDDKKQIAEVLIKKSTKSASELGLTKSETDKINRYINSFTVDYSRYFDKQYINNLFETVFLPRISDSNGNKLPLLVAQKRIRKLNILAHCHGAYVLTVLAEKMEEKMQELGYNDDEINAIQSQLLIVALEPISPLGVTKMRFISFMSAYDSNDKRPNNWVAQYVKEKRICDLENVNKQENDEKWDLKAGFLERQNGNVFYVKNRFNLVEYAGSKIIDRNEHNNSHFVSDKFTDDGRLLATFARNIIISGIKNSEAQDNEFIPLPPTEELILDGKNNQELSDTFEKLKQNGRDFLKTVCKYAKEKIKKMMPNKSIGQRGTTSERL